jgi:hypothetical protein
MTTTRKEEEENKRIIEINEDIYEFMALRAKEGGYDNVEEFINTVLEAGLEVGLETEAEKKEQVRKKKMNDK